MARSYSSRTRTPAPWRILSAVAWTRVERMSVPATPTEVPTTTISRQWPNPFQPAACSGKICTARSNREESAQQLRDFGARIQQQLADLTRAIQLNLGEVRTTLQAQLASLPDNEADFIAQQMALADTSRYLPAEYGL